MTLTAHPRPLAVLGAALIAAVLAVPATAPAAINLAPGDIKITDLSVTSAGAARWSFSFGPLQTDSPFPPEAALLHVSLKDAAVLRPLHGSGSVAGAAGQERFIVPPVQPGGNPLFRQGSAFVSLDRQDPDWAQIVKSKRARLSVAITITGQLVDANGAPVSPPLTDKAVARATATVPIPASVLKARAR